MPCAWIARTDSSSARLTSAGGGVCPAEAKGPKFRIIDGFSHPLIPRWEALLAGNDIGVAGIEFIADRDGRAWTCDVNTNTNYNPEAEAAAGVSGMEAIARHLAALAAAGRRRAA